jgi:antitoxin component of MazEF toxin-antitoxin module
MADSTVAQYPLRIVGKNQVTLPEEFMTAANLEKGDELRIEVRTPSDIRLIPYTRVRKDLITPEIQKILQQRRKEVESGEEMVSLEEVLKKAAVKNRAAAALSSRSGSKAKLQKKELEVS